MIFPFGLQILARSPSANEKRRVFILGAYPSALHVKWDPPRPHRTIHAIPSSIIET